MVNNESWTIYGSPIRGRSCGACKACCTQVPVELPSGPKDANVRCEHLCSKGCTIYANRPAPCMYWSCRWLFDPDTAALKRPDHSGYIIDPMFDTIMADGQPYEVVQVWVDPRRPEAYRDPALRAYLAEIGRRHRVPAIIRTGSAGDAILLVPPAISDTGDWFEKTSALVSKDEIEAKLATIDRTIQRTPVAVLPS